MSTGLLHRFLLSYPHHLLMSSSLRRPSLASPPSKRVKQAPPSPPAPPRPSTPAVVPPVPVHTKPVVSDDHKLSLFDILNIFRTRWFLNRANLIAKFPRGSTVWTTSYSGLTGCCGAKRT